MRRTKDFHLLFYAGSGRLFSCGIGPKLESPRGADVVAVEFGQTIDRFLLQIGRGMGLAIPFLVFP